MLSDWKMRTVHYVFRLSTAMGLTRHSRLCLQTKKWQGADVSIEFATVLLNTIIVGNHSLSAHHTSSNDAQSEHAKQGR